MSGPPVFYFDINSPFAWLAAERIHDVLLTPPVWQPVAFAFILRHEERVPWSLESEELREAGMRVVEERARDRNLQAVRWPPEWPRESYSIQAMRAATFAAEIGKVTAFALAAFRQQFNAGRAMSDVDNVLLAAAACELHPRALLQALKRESIKQKLKDATEDAITRGVPGVPTVRVGEELFWGDDRLEEAAGALAA